VTCLKLTPSLDWLLLTKRPEHIRELLPTTWVGLEMPHNVWLGCTAEDQQRADERIPLLLQCPAAVRFVSCEPLLGEIRIDYIPANYAGAVGDGLYPFDGAEVYDQCEDDPVRTMGRLHWVIAGCESGPGARPMQLDWARSLRDQCQEAGVAFFLKQARGEDGTGRLTKMPALDGKVWAEFPEVSP
jgi:protein gp37